MKNQFSAKKGLSIVLVFALILSLAVGTGNFAFATDGETAFKVNAGIAGIHIKLTADGLGSHEAITGSEGTAFFTEAYTYFNDTLGWGNSESSKETGTEGTGTEGETPEVSPEDSATPTKPVVTEVTVSYEVNLPALSIAERHAAANGNARYTGVSGSFTVTKENYKNVFSTVPISEVAFAAGKVMAIPFGKTLADAQPAVGVTVVYKEGETSYEAVSDAEGNFDFIPNVQLPAEEGATLSVAASDKYLPVETLYTDFETEGNILYVSEKFIGVTGTDYIYGDTIVDGYVKEPGNYLIAAGTGKTISLTQDNADSFMSSVTVTVAADGTTPAVFIKDDAGNISQPIKEILKLDNRGPIISGITSEKNKDLSFKDFGIFTNKDAVLSLDVTIADDGCGTGSLHMVEGTNDTAKIIQPSESQATDTGIKATFEIAFTEDYSKQLAVVAVDRLGNESTLVLLKDTAQSSTLNMESETPVMSEINISGTPSEHGWYSDVVTFSLTTSDAKSGLNTVDISINGKSVKNESFTAKDNSEKAYEAALTKELITSLANDTGSYKVVAVATDNAGNTVTKEVTVNADIEAPVLSFEGIKEGDIYQRNTALYINSTEKNYAAEGYKIFVVNNGKEEVYEKVNKVTLADFAGNGQYQVKAYAKDAAGNISEEIVINFTVDDTAPVITVKGTEGATATSYGWYNAPFTYKYEVSDNLTGVRSISATLNGSAVEAKDGDISITKELIESTINANGTYDIAITATDNAGNVTTDTNTVKIDLVAPVVSLSGVVSGSIQQGSPVLTVTNSEKHYAENGAAIIVSINGRTTTYDKVDAVRLSSFGGDGHYTVKVYARDAAGNVSATESVSFTIDNTAPIFNVTGVVGAEISPNGWYNAPFTFTYAISDNISGVSSVSATVNGKPVAASMTEIAFTKEVIEACINEFGAYEIVLSARDSAGNAVAYTETLKIDIVAPVLSMEGVEEGVHYNDPVEITFTNNEKHYIEEGAYINVVVTRDGEVTIEKKYDKVNSVDISEFEEDGDYTVTATAFDAAGNAAESITVNFVRDTTRPVIKISGAKEGQFYNSSKKIEVEITERYYEANEVEIIVTRTLDGKKSKVEFPWDNEEISTLNSQTFSKTGTYLITVNATDEAGNKAKTKTLSFTVDTIAPAVTISGVTEKIYTYDETVAPVISYSDSYYKGKTISLKRAGAEWYGNLAKTDGSGKISFADFQKTRENDGIYEIIVTVYDKAGNSTSKKANFAVNRFGSSFSYNKAMKEINGKYVQNVTDDFVITEKNVSELTMTDTEIKLDNKNIGKNAETKLSGVEYGINVYKHTLDKSFFETEGVYQINILSEDAAGNEMESKDFAGEIKFFVDRTAPVIDTKGFEEPLVNSETLTVSAEARDNISGVSLSATVNSQAADLTELEDGSIEILLGEGLSQIVAITATDEAGNRETIEREISVTPNKALYFVLDNKVPLGAGAGVAAGGGLLALILAKKRKKKEESK